jgi:hypothetical protein
VIFRALLFLGGVIASGLLLTACGPKGAPATPSSPPAEAQAGTKKEEASFDQDEGLYLPEATRQALGLTTAPVQKKAFQAERTMKFQVFREANEQPLPGMAYRSGYAYASTILAGSKPGLELGQTGEVLEKQDSQTAPTAILFQFNVLPYSNQAELLVEIADPRHQFGLTDFCTIQWQLSEVDAPAAVPDSALLKTTEGDFVYLRKEDRFVRTGVKLGAGGGGFTEITEGVAAGDIVVTHPVQTLWLTELKLKSGGSEP